MALIRAERAALLVNEQRCFDLRNVELDFYFGAEFDNAIWWNSKKVGRLGCVLHHPSKQIQVEE